MLWNAVYSWDARKASGICQVVQYNNCFVDYSRLYALINMKPHFCLPLTPGNRHRAHLKLKYAFEYRWTAFVVWLLKIPESEVYHHRARVCLYSFDWLPPTMWSTYKNFLWTVALLISINVSLAFFSKWGYVHAFFNMLLYWGSHSIGSATNCRWCSRNLSLINCFSCCASADHQWPESWPVQCSSLIEAT